MSIIIMQQAHTADMLDEVVLYVKQLQRRVQVCHSPSFQSLSIRNDQ
jgi:hypothetical protein